MMSVEDRAARTERCIAPPRETVGMAEAALFIVGASGVGKTAVLEHLCGETDFDASCHFFDSVGVPTPEEREAMGMTGEEWQARATEGWVHRLAADPAALAVLEGQTRPSFLLSALERAPIPRWAIVLLDCPTAVRTHRLTALRGQPDLANAQMESWAAYLMGQAHALALPVIDTSDRTIAEVAAAVRRIAERLRDSVGTGASDGR